MSSRFQAAILLASLSGVVFISGCSVSGRDMEDARQKPITMMVDQNLIFNPEWVGIASVDVPRREWPSTAGYEQTAEDSTEYRETIIDSHGSFRGQGDRYYRRFNAVRTGRKTR